MKKSAYQPLIDLRESKFSNLASMCPSFWLNSHNHKEHSPKMLFHGSTRREFIKRNYPLQLRSYDFNSSDKKFLKLENSNSHLFYRTLIALAFYDDAEIFYQKSFSEYEKSQTSLKIIRLQASFAANTNLYNTKKYSYLINNITDFSRTGAPELEAVIKSENHIKKPCLIIDNILSNSKLYIENPIQKHLATLFVESSYLRPEEAFLLLQNRKSGEFRFDFLLDEWSRRIIDRKINRLMVKCKYEEAFELITLAKKVDPNCPRVFALGASVKFKMGEFNEAKYWANEVKERGVIEKDFDPKYSKYNNFFSARNFSNR